MPEFYRKRLDKIKEILDNADPGISNYKKSKYIFDHATKFYNPPLTAKQVNDYLVDAGLSRVY